MSPFGHSSQLYLFEAESNFDWINFLFEHPVIYPTHPSIHSAAPFAYPFSLSLSLSISLTNEHVSPDGEINFIFRTGGKKKNKKKKMYLYCHCRPTGRQTDILFDIHPSNSRDTHFVNANLLIKDFLRIYYYYYYYSRYIQNSNLLEPFRLKINKYFFISWISIFKKLICLFIYSSK